MPIVDQYGQPISKLPPEVARAGGAVAVNQNPNFQYPTRGLTPQKLVRILREADEGYLEMQAELIAEMEERDGHLMSQLQIRYLALSGLEWRVTPADSTPEAGRIAEAFAAWWDSSNQTDLILDLADGIAQGVSIVGMAWERTDGMWLPAQLEQLQTSRLQFEHTTKRFKYRTDANPTGEFLPFGGAIEHRARAKAGTQTRAGLGRTRAWWYLFKHYGVKDWLVFAELFGVPFRIGKFDPSTGEPERAALEQAVRSLGSDAAGVISRDTEIEIIEVAKQGGSDVFDKLIDLCDREISKATIGGSLTSSAGQNGSQALGMVQQRVRLDIRDADAKSLAATLRRDLAQAFVAFNFGTDKLRLAPRITPQLEEPEDLVQKADVLTKLQALGLEIPESWVRETFGVPALQGKELTLKRAAPTQSALEAFTRQASLEDASPKGVIEGQAYTLGLIGNAQDASRETVQNIISRITELVQQNDTPEGLRDALIQEFASLPTSQLSAILESAMTLATLAGRYALREGEL